MKWSDLILGLAAALSPLTAMVGGLLFFRQTRQKKNLENTREKVQIGIDEETRNRLVQDAAGINQEREQRREEWWASQISVLRGEIEAERALSNRRFKRLNQLEDWATRHMAWDQKAWSRIRETDPEFEPPPMLPDEVIEAVVARRREIPDTPTATL